MSTAWIWTAATVYFISAGSLLAAWALFWDRSRGRRRCPKCWYDLTHLPPAAEKGGPTPVCPECGHTAKSERQLKKTRRRLGPVPLCLLLTALAYESWAVPRIQSEGWTGAVPTTALIVMTGGPLTDEFAQHSDWFNHLESALEDRCKAKDVWSWQRDVWRWKTELAFLFDRRMGVSAPSAQSIAALSTTTLPPAAQPQTLSELSAQIEKTTGLKTSADAGVQQACAASPLQPVPLACTPSEALDRVLGHAGPGPFICGWGVKNGSLLLTQAPPTVLEVYDTRDVLGRIWASRWAIWNACPPARPPDYDEYEELAKDLMNLVMGSIRPEDWRDNGGDSASIRSLNGRLLIVAPAQHHQEVRGLLSMLRAPTSPDHIAHAPGSVEAIALLQRLDSSIVDLSMGTMSFSELLDRVSDQTGIRLAPDWPLLARINIDRSTACRVNARHQVALDAITNAVDPAGRSRIALSPRAGMVVIEPRPGPRVIMSYDLSDFIALRPDRVPISDLCKDVCDIVSGLVETESWVDNGGDEASMRMFESKLLIKAPLPTHYQVQKLLALIRAGTDPQRLRVINESEPEPSWSR